MRCASLPVFCEAKTFLLKGGESALAISKERKTELIQHYTTWLTQSKGIFITEYTGMTVKDVDELRRRAREVGGEFHVMKNTLGKIAFMQANLPLPEHFLAGSTAVAFCSEDAPALAKVLDEFTRISEVFKIKGGFLDGQPISAEGVKTLASLPPIPVLRAQLLGLLLAPASQLARTLAEPGRRVAAVIKAFAERETAQAAN